MGSNNFPTWLVFLGDLDLDAFAFTAKKYGVVAHNVATTDYGETNAAILTSAGVTVTGPVSDIIQRFAPGFGDSFTHGQGSA